MLSRLLPQVRDIRRAGSAALDLCGVASGTCDAYYERGVNAWDIAAARLVVTEAGGTVRGLADAPAGPELVIAAGQPLCDALASLLAELGAGTDRADAADVADAADAADAADVDGRQLPD